jgi:hypothetical protein
MADVVHMLTTTDNPYNPFTQWEEWYAFDAEKGYNTPGILAKIAVSSDELPEELESLAIEEAIDEIVRINALGLYRKITETDTDMIRPIKWSDDGAMDEVEGPLPDLSNI